MSGQPFWDANDGRPKIRTDWTTPDGTRTADVEFTLDSGADRSTITISLTEKRGLTFQGLVNVGTAGAPAVAVEVDGGILEFEAEDQSGQPRTLAYRGPLIILSGNLIGNDVLQYCKALFLIDHRQSPPDVKLIS